MVTAKSIMTKDVLMISIDHSILAAAKLIASKLVSSLVVVKNKKPIAMISERDIVNGIVTNKKNVKDVMDKEFLIIKPFTKVSELSNKLRNDGIKIFLVIEDDKLVGIITETDIIESTRDFTRFHQIIQDVILTIFGIATAFFRYSAKSPASKWNA